MRIYYFFINVPRRGLFIAKKYKVLYNFIISKEVPIEQRKTHKKAKYFAGCQICFIFRFGGDYTDGGVRSSQRRRQAAVVVFDILPATRGAGAV